MEPRNHDSENPVFRIRRRLRFSRRLRNRSADRFRSRRLAVHCEVLFVHGRSCDDLPIEFEADVPGTKSEILRSLRFPGLYGLDAVRLGM